MLTFLEDLAREAGALLLQHRGAPLRSTEKPDAGFVTEADLRSEELVVRALLSRFPDSTIVAEESGRRHGSGEWTWYVDPLDGTTNFAQGLPGFAVSIAGARRGALECGVVFAPALGELFAAQRGLGATLDGKALRVAPAREPSGSVLATGDEYERGPAFVVAMDNLRRLYAQARVLRIPGSVALALSDVAAGRLDGFWVDHFNSWDVAAGTLFVQEAGGVVANGRGGAIALERASRLLAGAAATIDWMQRVLGP